MDRSVRVSSWGRTRLVWLLAVLSATPILVSPAGAGRTATMYRMEPRGHGAAGVTQAQIREAVLELAGRRGWDAHVRTAGVVETDASWGRGKHRFTVVTVFDDETFVVRYVSSYNLGYDDAHCNAPRPGDSPADMQRARDRLRISRDQRCVGTVIHPSYNDFVRGFEDDIAKAIARLSPAGVSEIRKVAVADTVVEESRRLEALHAAGVLTQDELQSHRRLLVGSDVVETNL